MADIFRLLSRSTSFAKGASGGSNIQQFCPAPTSKPHKSPTRNAIPTELDFFGMGNPEDKISDKKRKREEDSDVSADDNSDSEDEVDAVPVLESSDDIRKVLWEHKLKYTVLAGPQKATEEIGEKKKKIKQLVLIPPLTSFAQLRSAKHGYALSKRVYENVLRQGYTAPTEVQMGALPVLMRKDGVSEMVPGDVDLLTCAPTGSGKTLAYVVPLLDGILAGRKKRVQEKGIKAIVLAPTKELAGQIVNEVKKLSVGTGIKVSLMRKGMAATSTKGENAGIHIKSDILVSTPLLLLHAIESEEGKGEFKRVRRLVLDEADVLLDELFRNQTLGIWKALRETANGNLRTSLWSATISSGTEEIARNMMLPTLDELTSKPKKTKKSKPPTQTILRLIVGLKDTAIPTVHQTLLYTATEPGKLLALRQLFTTSFHPPALIFVQSIPRAQALYNEILYDLPTSRIAVLHASLTDTVRQDVMDRFRRGEIWVLITTDLLARGVDFRGVHLVVNYDIPTSAVAYIHRVGRTGRAGRDGGAVTYYTKEDIGYVKSIANVIAVAQKMAGRDDGVQKWLLDALPKTSRRERKQLKMHGMKARSAERISTKSGYERQKADAKRGAVEASKKRKMAEVEGHVSDDMGDDGEEFMGIDE